MALIHYLYVGHFAPSDGFITLKNMQPVYRAKIDAHVVSHLLEKYLGVRASIDRIPTSWHLTVKPDHILCDRYGSSPEAIAFVADYAMQTGSQIVDLGTFSFVTPDDLWRAASEST